MYIELFFLDFIILHMKILTRTILILNQVRRWMEDDTRIVRKKKTHKNTEVYHPFYSFSLFFSFSAIRIFMTWTIIHPASAAYS